MARPRRATEAMDLEALAAPMSHPEALQCCCGKIDCVFLKHNCSVLDSVEKDVHTAARLGQALLARHEALMASAENERYEMQSRIDKLETDKKSLEVENARTIMENRALLDQLESLNNCVTDSETQIKSLEATLQSSYQAIRKLEMAESRAMDLEIQISALESEQATLQTTLVSTEAEARSAMQRWRKAEKGISELQEKLEKMERETSEERERHAKVLARAAKQRSMEKELNTAAGRLKGAAAAKTLGDGKNGGTVVSHFVRDLLSDNANLQVGIAELREMLTNSNDEIQLLREQLIFHQPADDGVNRATTLGAELKSDDWDPQAPPRSPRSPRSPQQPYTKTAVSQDLHIHHHYHVAKPVEHKKSSKKKKQGFHPNIFTQQRPFSPLGPQSPGQWRLEQRTTSPNLNSHSVKDSVSTIPSTCWSVFSDQPSELAPSSAPSSPMSHHRRLSLFDRDGYDTLDPSSPTTSVEPVSPAWTRRRNQNMETQHRKFSTPRPLFLGDVPENEPHNIHPLSPGAWDAPQLTENGRPIMNGSDRTPNRTCTDLSSANFAQTHKAITEVSVTPSLDDSCQTSRRPHLHRAASRESVLSLSGGLEIHTLKARPSQLSIKPLGTSSANTGLSAVTARPTLARVTTGGKRGSVVLRDNLLSLPSIKATASQADGQQQQVSGGGGIGRLVSWRLWGGNNARTEQANSSTSTPSPSERSQSVSSSALTPTDSPGSSTTEISEGMPTGTPVRAKKKKPSKEVAFSPRNFGINQPGSIPGFQAFLAAHQQRGPPTQVVPKVVDTEALREGLEDLTL